jgi:hypothetical protein
MDFDIEIYKREFEEEVSHLMINLIRRAICEQLFKLKGLRNSMAAKPSAREEVKKSIAG